MMTPPPAQRPGGYLQRDALDILQILPPAPVEGDPLYESDREIFRQTRALKGSARWQMAADDAELGPAKMLHHFSCSLDMELSPENAPRTLRVLQRATQDTGRAVGVAKNHFKRLRPFWIDEGETCRAREEMGKSYDYPSGHATAGWTWAMVLAQLMPERATAILARGRAIGESRIVCGLHNATAVEGARTTVSAVMAAVVASPEYQADLEAARAELQSLRTQVAKPDPARCAAESELVAMPILGKANGGT